MIIKKGTKANGKMGSCKIPKNHYLLFQFKNNSIFKDVFCLFVLFCFVLFFVRHFTTLCLFVVKSILGYLQVLRKAQDIFFV
jgi:hypothetical protein